MDHREFGKFLEGLRGKMTLRDAAAKCGLSHTYIRDLELGINRKTKAPIQPSHDTLKRLSQAYDFDYEELLRLGGILDKENHENINALDELLNQKVSKLTDDKKKHLLRYIEIIQEETK